jgi:hypothetical protein
METKTKTKTETEMDSDEKSKNEENYGYFSSARWQNHLNYAHARVSMMSDSNCPHKHRGDRAEAIKKSHKKKRKDIRANTSVKNMEVHDVL